MLTLKLQGGGTISIEADGPRPGIWLTAQVPDAGGAAGGTGAPPPGEVQAREVGSQTQLTVQEARVIGQALFDEALMCGRAFKPGQVVSMPAGPPWRKGEWR